MTGTVRASVAVLLAMWLLRVMFDMGGSLINVLLLLAGIAIEYNSRPVAGRSRNTGTFRRRDLSGTSRSEDKIAA